MWKLIVDRVLQNISSLLSLTILFLIIAGTGKVWGFWIYLTTVLVYQVVSLLYILPRYPAYLELARVRRERRSDVKKWDRVLVFLLMGVTFLMYGMAAYDVGRAHLSQLPLWLAPLGILLYAAGTALNQWAMIANPHFEKGVRIQTDRAHQVIAAGPYRYVRHPGYLGSLLGFVSFPLIVGSGVALLGSALCMLGMMVRTGYEDQTLRMELAGYAEYAQAVRYRLIPYIW